MSILHLKVAIFSAFRSLFFTVQLHVLHVKSSALGLKMAVMRTESKGHPHRPHYFTAAPTQHGFCGRYDKNGTSVTILPIFFGSQCSYTYLLTYLEMAIVRHQTDDDGADYDKLTINLI